MLKIRLSRVGRKNLATYRIVVANQRDKRNGQSLEIIGTYDPKTKPSTVVLNKEKAKEWLAKGAQPSDTVKSIFVKQNLLPKTKSVKKFAEKPGKKAIARVKKAEEAK